jgi:hypothetical protein
MSMCAGRGSLATPLEGYAGWAKGVRTENDKDIVRSYRSYVPHSRRHFLKSARSSVFGPRSSVCLAARLGISRTCGTNQKCRLKSPVLEFLEVVCFPNQAMRPARGKTGGAG